MNEDAGMVEASKPKPEIRASVLEWKNLRGPDGKPLQQPESEWRRTLPDKKSGKVEIWSTT